jgi:hypothetical protein
MYRRLHERASCNDKRVNRGVAARIGAAAREMRKGLAVAATVLGLAAVGAPSGFAQTFYKDSGCDPYKDYSCLDTYLGTGVLERFFNYYALEWGKATAPADPNALPGRIEGWPRTPGTIPPLAYSEWPTGAVSSIGVTRPNSVDSPLMAALSNTDAGKWMYDNHIQIYGWVNPGFDITTLSRGKGASAPVAYTYSSDAVYMDQAVLYIERLPDTVQTDHIDWGFRLSGLYGSDYRYTTSYGVASWQFNKKNLAEGYDLPMEYIDIYDPFILNGFYLRIGRYVSIPDIEAQLSPNNPTYTHSFTYGYDNYTNTGIVGSLQVTPKLLIQLGLTDGTETPLWHSGTFEKNLYTQAAAQAWLDNTYGPGAYTAPATDPIYHGSKFRVDPGNQPTLTACARYAWNDGWDTFYPCIDGQNDQRWGYNNLAWHGFTYYHRFNDQWHIDFESYFLTEHDVLNNRNPIALATLNAGGTWDSPQYIPANASNLAYCPTASQLTCNTWSLGVLTYISYTPDPLNNWVVRFEWYDDPQGWRTGTGGETKYFDTMLSWQHWFSPQIELRPEISYWRSFGTAAFNGNFEAGIPGNKKEMAEFASDVIIHF